LTRRLALTFFV